jgi:gliding motility-associated-like protein
MRKLYSLLSPVFFILVALCGHAQDFSNKGKDFWVGYGLHCRMLPPSGTNTQDMVLYFATDQVTTVTVSVPGTGYTQTYSNIPANTIFTSNAIPKTGSQDARLTTEGILNKGVHIESDKPIVAYAHIYNGSVSGATLLFPTPTLGKEYYSINFTQYSNDQNSNCWFYAVATDTGTTTIQVIPTANTQTMVAGQTYTYNLTQGQVFNALGTETVINSNQTSGVDLTGSVIKTVSSGNGGCKRIAVFSGSGKINIKCPIGASSTSADNYMVQAFPKVAWGKYYLTVPTQQMPYNFFRIAVSDPATVVTFNGTVLTGLIGNFYYQVSQNNTPNVISANQPIMVAQYITTANQCGNTAITSNGDPEVIYLSPVEQNIDKVIINSTPNAAINANWHYANVVITNGGTALSSFRIDGNPIPINSFLVHPQNSSYSYLIYNFPSPGSGQHTLQSDSGFNAIAYGYGPAESYGYNAGTNIKDIYQFIQISNPYATVNFPAACKNQPFYFSIVFPYQPTQIDWHFFGLFPDTTVYPLPILNPLTGYDSTWTVNGKQLYRYRLPSSYSVTSPGTYPIEVVAANPTPDGCGGIQYIEYNLEVFDTPASAFSFTTSGCVTDSVYFSGTASNTGGRPVTSWSWNFGDAATATIQNPVHKYNLPGSFTSKFSFITDIGCKSDTTSHIVSLTGKPTAKFGISFPQCLNQQIIFTDSSTAAAGSTIMKWYWNFGDGSPQVIATTGVAQQHTYTSAGPFVATLVVESQTGCQSVVYSKTINVHAVPVANFSFSNACLPAGTTQFTDLSTISDGTQNLFTWSWNFGDAGTSAAQNPVHNYATLGPFNVHITVTSNNGCVDDTIKLMNTVYAQPLSNFMAPVEVCHGDSVHFTDQSNAPNSTVTNWSWNFGDGATDTTQNPVHLYAAPGSYTITHTVTSAIGCVSTVSTKTVVVNPLPTANFNTSLPACETRTIVFSDASTANVGTLTKWTWDFGDVSNAVYTNGNPFVHVYATAGTYNATLKVENSKGCVSTIYSKQIVVNYVPLAGFISPAICLTDPFAPFVDTSSIPAGSITSWNWNFGDPNANVANPNTSTIQNPLHRYTVVGSYTATLIVTSSQGCKDTVVQSFTVNGSIPVANFNPQNPNTLCSNQNVTITDASTVDFGNVVKTIIYWDWLGDTTQKTVFNFPAVNQNYSHLYPEFGSPTTKTYAIKMISYSGINCLDVITKTITVLSTPTVQFNPLTNICANDQPVQFNQGYITNGLSGIGVYSGTATLANGVFTPAVAGPGLFTIRFTYTAANTCSNYKEQQILVYPVPIVNAGPDRTLLEGTSIKINGSGSGNGIKYLWTPNIAIDSPTIATPKVFPSNDIYYYLTVTSGDGCRASDTMFVKVLKLPTVPNIFSPNGDGVHDRWEIQYLSSYPGCTVDIFNRYGQLIFHSVGYNTPWDGTVNGKPVPVGTYYYIVQPKNGREKMSGYVDVIR